MTVTTVDETPQKRSPALGVVILFVAVLAYLAIPAVIVAAEHAGLAPAGAALPSKLAVPLVIFGAISAVAILAAVTGRGRGWAIAALVVAVANDYSPIHAVISELVHLI